ncbi:MAG TPA: type II CAAX endopeptidase family protein [Bacteriovoracaceae bacterium]|nr:type II CAAX endopeptidase family protein [Bacteriovoracaceae bacterium]
MISFFFLVILYFAFSWGLPWHELPSTISFSYIFDLAFALVICFFFRLPWKFKWKGPRNTILFISQSIILAVFSISAAWFWSMPVPFRLVGHLEWHLLLFAPVLEELIFRQTFQRFLIKRLGGKRVTSMLVAAIFAFSHLIALRVLPDEYIPFIGFQVFYTFVLGVICGQALLRTHSILSPILIHFLFNLCFYFAVQLGII